MKNKVSPEEAEVIANELAQKDEEVKQTVQKLSKSETGDSEELGHRELELKNFRDALYGVFSQVLKQHGITEEDKIQLLLEEIRTLKGQLFVDCIRKEQKNKQP